MRFSYPCNICKVKQCRKLDACKFEEYYIAYCDYYSKNKREIKKTVLCAQTLIRIYELTVNKGYATINELKRFLSQYQDHLKYIITKLLNRGLIEHKKFEPDKIWTTISGEQMTKDFLKSLRTRLYN